ncbi:cell surface protein [Lactobacillus sp. CBA3606]|uniref:cell surface protein n=1 Tax=Lactobacillus sp. CBA3606 TaxID=2099789 RepID=UPI000CFCA8CD|nr:cell surface protein [Lactobacillus sp. CBA3606]AVK64090.1 cell surface protein [Lactobacillus sp. CBA3606]
MGKRKTFWQLSLGLIILISIAFGGRVVGQAADTFVDVTASFDNGVNKVLHSYGTAFSITSWPEVKSVTANNTIDGQITNRTTELQVTYRGTFGIGTGGFNSVYAEIMDTSGNILGTDANTRDIFADLGHKGTGLGQADQVSSFSMDASDTQKIDFTWGKWAGTVPMYIALKFPTNNAAKDAGAIGLAKIDEYKAWPADANPTITSTLTTNSTTITGKGTTAGDVISSDVNGVTTTVGSDKTYTLNLGTTLAGKSKVTVTEKNSVGDAGTASADVTKDLTIAADKTSLNLDADDVVALKGKSDSDMISWIVKQAGITVKSGSGGTATFTADETGLAATIQALAENGSTTVNIYAKNGADVSDKVAVSLIKEPTTLTFGTLSADVGFGSTTVPSKETVISPTSNFDINVADARATGSKWYVYATATPLTTGTGTAAHTLKGNLIYKDGTNQQNLTNTSTLVGSGTKVAGTTDTKVTSSWDSSKGIFLDVFPGVYAGDYTGQVNWSLQDTPTD